MPLKAFFREVKDMLEKHNGVFLVATKDESDMFFINNTVLSCSGTRIGLGIGSRLNHQYFYQKQLVNKKNLKLIFTEIRP